jgi:hypothetical protein
LKTQKIEQANKPNLGERKGIVKKVPRMLRVIHTESDKPMTPEMAAEALETWVDILFQTWKKKKGVQ